MGSFRHVKVSPQRLIFTPTQREQVLTIENGTNQSMDFEIAAHRSTRTGELSLFQSNLPSGRLSAFSRERILIQYCGDFGELDTDCAETLQLLFRNSQQELHLITLDCEFELDETGGSVIRTGRQTMRSDGLLLEEDLDIIYGKNLQPHALSSSDSQDPLLSSKVPIQRQTDPSSQSCPVQHVTPSKGHSRAGGNFLSSFIFGKKRSTVASSTPATIGTMVDNTIDPTPLRPVLQRRKPAFRKLNYFSRLTFVLSLAMFASLVYLIFFSSTDSSWARLIKIYGLSKNANTCSFLWSPSSSHLALDLIESHLHDDKNKCLLK